MRIIGRVVLALLAAAAVLIAVAYMLPREVTVERAITIDAPPEAVFPHVNSLQKFAEWSPWHSIDPDMVQTFRGPGAGVGNRMEWSSADSKVGSGAQEITLSVPNKRVESALDFGGMGTAAAWEALAPADGGTEVTWRLTADMGNSPVGRYMGLVMDRMVGPDYDKGLARLKEIVEAE